MKTLVLIGDGMADFPLDECGGKTPIEVADTSAMDTLATAGISGLFMPIPYAYPAGSDIGNLSLFAYDPHETFSGRAPLEAANQGIKLAENELVFRCNLVTLGDGKMVDFTAGHISNEDAAGLIEFLNEKMAATGLRFHAGVSYRHLATMKANQKDLRNLLALKCTPPHDIIGQEYSPSFPAGEDAELAISLMEQAQEHLQDAPINKKRSAAGDPPANSIWLWGQGQAPTMKSYAERFGISGAVISAVDLVNGIGRSAGLDVIDVEGATGYLDTNYEGKVAAALSALDDVDFVYLHVEAPDEASHEGKVDLKLQAIEDFDARVVAPCFEALRKRGDCRIVVAPDHITSIDSRTHASGPVPFILWGPGIAPDERNLYSESAAAQAGVLFPQGHELVAQTIQAKTLNVADLG